MEVRREIVVSCPRDQVAAFMFDPRNDGVWTTAVVSVRPLTEGLLQEGSRVERTVRFAGKEFTYQYTVSASEAGRFVEMRVEKPFPMWIRYELVDVTGGTRVSIHTTGRPKGFFRLAGPLMKRKMKDNISADLANLKREIEALPR